MKSGQWKSPSIARRIFPHAGSVQRSLQWLLNYRQSPRPWWWSPAAKNLLHCSGWLRLNVKDAVIHAKTGSKSTSWPLHVAPWSTEALGCCLLDSALESSATRVLSRLGSSGLFQDFVLVSTAGSSWPSSSLWISLWYLFSDVYFSQQSCVSASPFPDLAIMEKRDVLKKHRLNRQTILDLCHQLESDLLPHNRNPTSAESSLENWFWGTVHSCNCGPIWSCSWTTRKQKSRS